MAEISISVTKISPKVLELRTVVRGQVFVKRYLGWTPKEATSHFEKWVKSQETI